MRSGVCGRGRGRWRGGGLRLGRARLIRASPVGPAKVILRRDTVTALTVTLLRRPAELVGPITAAGLAVAISVHPAIGARLVIRAPIIAARPVIRPVRATRLLATFTALVWPAIIRAALLHAVVTASVARLGRTRRLAITPAVHLSTTRTALLHPLHRRATGTAAWTAAVHLAASHPGRWWRHARARPTVRATRSNLSAWGRAIVTRSGRSEVAAHGARAVELTSSVVRTRATRRVVVRRTGAIGPHRVVIMAMVCLATGVTGLHHAGAQSEAEQAVA